MRPDYSELAAILPEAEVGRDDPAKLGFFIVDVTDIGHTVRPVRTYGRTGGDPLPVPAAALTAPDWTCPVGVTLRHDWAATVGFPADGLDPFVRKVVRNDYPLLALWESRITNVRVPIGDIMSVDRQERLNDLSRMGLRFSVFSAGPPDDATASGIEASAGAVVRWEIIVQPDQIEMPRALESGVFDNDDAVARRVAEAAAVGLRHPEVPMFLDGFMDHDRGYYRRHGLIDRRFNPRPAMHALISFLKSPR